MYKASNTRYHEFRKFSGGGITQKAIHTRSENARSLGVHTVFAFAVTQIANGNPWRDVGAMVARSQPGTAARRDTREGQEQSTFTKHLPHVASSDPSTFKLNQPSSRGRVNTVAPVFDLL